MKHLTRWTILLLLSMSLSSLFAQQKTTLSGHVKDASNGEALIQASVIVQETRSGAYTNEYGFFSLSLTPGTYTIKFGYLGYESQILTVELTESKQMEIELVNKDITTQEVVISSRAEDENVKQVEMSTVKLQISELKRLPQLLGEVDIIRNIQLLPGVTTVGEGATGFNVRGGNVDQNLILLDESPVYNSSHLLGFFSIFNADAIKDVKLYKGGIPAKYGGRLSSVLDVRQKEGNNKRLAGTGGIGLLSSRLTVEGPLGSEKGSFMVAGRRSYMDLFLKLSPDSNISDNTLYFYDLNAKVNYQVGEKDRLYLSAYSGNDVFGFRDAFNMSWGNQSTTLRWNHLFSDKLFSNFTAVYSDYKYQIGIPESDDTSSGDNNPFNWTSHIVNYNAKADFGWYVSPQFKLDFGGNALLYRFKPGDVDFLGERTNFNDFELEHEHALETGVYASAEQKVNDRLTLRYGVRVSAFQNIGAGEVYIYEEGKPRTIANIVDTVSYGKREVIETFTGLEPRFSANFVIDDSRSLKASYNRMKQYIHLVSNTTSATPLDIWKPSGKYVQPATVDQMAIGYFQNFADNQFEASVELYYKMFDNLLDFKDGAQLLFNPTIETELLSGEGRAYGAEVMIRKQKGKLKGWLGYTLSRTERKVEGINNNTYFPANYDKLHDVSLVMNYQLSKKWDVSANFAYMSGRPITYPDGRYDFDGVVIPNYGNRNGARTPAYHRLDFSANWDLSKPDKRFKSSLSFGVYNVYNRRNPYSISFRQNADDPSITEAVQLSVFGSAIPSVTYNFSF